MYYSIDWVKFLVLFELFFVIIRPAYAMTMNKYQGQTLGFFGLSLENPVFCHGQLHVAFSRVSRVDHMKISLFS